MNLGNPCHFTPENIKFLPSWTDPIHWPHSPYYPLASSRFPLFIHRMLNVLSEIFLECLNPFTEHRMNQHPQNSHLNQRPGLFPTFDWCVWSWSGSDQGYWLLFIRWWPDNTSFLPLNQHFGGSNPAVQLQNQSCLFCLPLPRTPGGIAVMRFCCNPPLFWYLMERGSKLFALKWRINHFYFFWRCFNGVFQGKFRA